MDETKSNSLVPIQDSSLSSRPAFGGPSHAEEAGMRHAAGTSQPDVATEAVALGDFSLVDALNAPLVASRPKPRGLLPIPPEVEAAIAADDTDLLERHGIVPTAEDRQRQLNSLTLQYYYGGHDVAYRLTPEGVELLAAGLPEIRDLVQGMSQEELLTLKIGQP